MGSKSDRKVVRQLRAFLDELEANPRLIVAAIFWQTVVEFMASLGEGVTEELSERVEAAIFRRLMEYADVVGGEPVTIPPFMKPVLSEYHAMRERLH